MQKFAAVLCVVALMLTMAVPALANPSIGDLSLNAVSKTPGVEVAVADAEDYEGAVAEAVEQVNDENSKATVEEVVKALEGELPEEKGNVAEYDWVTTFAEVASSDEDVKPIIAIDPSLVEIEKLADYLILFVSPEGEVSFIDLVFDAETNEITAELPGAGIIALIQKIAE